MEDRRPRPTEHREIRVLVVGDDKRRDTKAPSCESGSPRGGDQDVRPCAATHQRPERARSRHQPGHLAALRSSVRRTHTVEGQAPCRQQLEGGAVVPRGDPDRAPRRRQASTSGSRYCTWGSFSMSDHTIIAAGLHFDEPSARCLQPSRPSLRCFGGGAANLGVTALSDARAIAYLVGARPNYVKMAPSSRARRRAPELGHVVINTGQHYDREMSGIFFDELGSAAPDSSSTSARARTELRRHARWNASRPCSTAFVHWHSSFRATSTRRSRARSWRPSWAFRSHISRPDCGASTVDAGGDQPRPHRPGVDVVLHPQSGGGRQPAARRESPGVDLLRRATR